MPFTPEPDLPDNPAVRIFFSGLLILEPSADASTCEVFVHRSAPAHHLTIEVRQKQPGKPDLIKMRHVGPLPYALAPPDIPGAAPIHGLTILATKALTGIKAYNPGTPSSEGEGFNLAINLDDSQYHHGTTGNVDPLGGRPSILLNDAVFYTADKTSSALEIDLVKANNPTLPIRRLDPFASLIGANIYLADGERVSVEWHSQGKLERLELAKPAQGISYEIYIINDPLYETESEDLPHHDEFREYYKILPQVPTQDQFKLNVKFPVGQPGGPPAIPRGSTQSPCMPVVKGG